MASIFVEQGYQVDIYVDQLRRREPRLEKPGITLHTFKAEIGQPEPFVSARTAGDPLGHPRLLRWIYPYARLPRAAFWSVVYGSRRLLQNVRLTARWLQSLHAFLKWVERESTPEQGVYGCWIGVEPDGLMVAWRASRGSGSKLVYYSLELLLEENLRSWMHRLKKRLERRANQSADLTITQDEARAALLAEANRLSLDKMVYIPVGARGEPVVDDTDYLRQEFELDPDCKIILYAGSIADWSCSRELAQAAQTWPADWKLILHGKPQPFSEKPGYIEDILRLAEHDQIILSTGWVPFDELDTLVASADVGLALYFDEDRNRQLLASSSGKIAQYLKCGLPIVVNDFPHTRALIEDEHCGIAVSGADEVAGAVESILGDYERYRTGAVRRYVEYYQTDRYILDLVHRLGL
ncbi:glycosyltransferase [Chloroflexota bacterium]